MTGFDNSRLKNCNISVILPALVNERTHNSLIEQFFT